jgi:hypothetical protein
VSKELNKLLFLDQLSIYTLGFDASFNISKASLSVFLSNSLKLPMKFDHSEFQFYQAKFHLRIEKIICWFYRVIKERNIPGSLLEVTV